MSRVHRTAYVVTERDGRSYWNRIGVSFLNKDDSETVILDAFPASGKLVLRTDTAGSGYGGRAGGGGGSSRTVAMPAEGNPGHQPPAGFDPKQEIDDDDIPF